jgi:hypothetical protein
MEIKKPKIEPVFKKPFPKKTALDEVQEVISIQSLLIN